MPVVVTEYDPDWPARFDAEAEELARVFGAQSIGIVHIGSTSVPGLAAKPVIDIMPVVRNIHAVDALNAAMELFGYEAMGEYGIAGRRYFRKGEMECRYHVHVYETGSAEALRHLAFRDFLRSHGDVASRYGALKSKLATRFTDDIEAYMDGKDPFIKKAERDALAWWARVPLIVLSGPVGAGKTTVGEALSDLLAAHDIAHAFADVDALSSIYPRCPGDRFGTAFALANLQALWRNARSCGARCLIAARVIEDEEELHALQQVVPGAHPVLVRLRAPLTVLQERLRRREHGSSLAWHLDRAAHLADQLDQSGPADFVVDAGEGTPEEIAQAIWERAGVTA